MTFWAHVLLTIVSVSITALIGYTLKLLNLYVMTKTHSVKVRHAFQIAEQMVLSIVGAATHTFTDTLEGAPDWNGETMKLALDQSGQTAKQLISTDVQNIIQNETGDFESWLAVKIKQHVHSHIAKKKAVVLQN